MMILTWAATYLFGIETENAGNLSKSRSAKSLAEVIQFDDRLRYSSVKSHHSNSTRSVQSSLTFHVHG